MNPNRLAASAFVLALATQAAHAAIIVNTSGYTITTPCSTSEVSLSPDGNADYCAGYFGLGNYNPTSERTALNNVTDGDDWWFIYKVEPGKNPGSGVFDGIKITLSASTFAADNGTWTVSWEDTNGTTASNLPLTVDIAAAFKAGSGQSGAGIAYFLFEDYILTSTPTTQSGSFNLVVDKALSHEALFIRFGDNNVITPPQGDIPEPGVLFLMGAGLLGLGMARRRKPA